MILHKYKIFCETDNKFEYVWKPSTDAAPSTCPTDTAHTCTANSVAIEETVDDSVSTVDTQHQVDSELAPMVRLKYAPKGWQYQAHFIEVVTSKIDGVYSKDKSGNNTGFCSLKYFKADGTEITSGLQSDLDTDCVHTRLIWEPNHSIEIISGSIKNLSNLSQDVRVWATAAPHISAPLGSKAFLQGGLNLKFLEGKEPLRTDGRASKFIAYDTTYYSHRWHFDVKHPVGVQHDFQLLLEFYKA